MAEDFEKVVNAIWKALGIMRGYLEVSSYNVVLCILHLYQNMKFRPVLEGMADNPNDLQQINKAVQDEVKADPSGRLNYLTEVLHVFEHDLSELCKVEGTLSHLLKAFSSVSDEWYQKHYGELYDSLLERITISSGRSSEARTQPAELSSFVAELCHYDGTGCIYNPYGGTASYAIGFGANSDYIGQEINPFVWAVGVMRLVAHGMKHDEFKIGDSYLDWRGCSPRCKDGNLYDYVVATPPFRCQIPRDDELTNPFSSLRYLEEDFLLNGAHSLKSGGQLVGIFPAQMVIDPRPAIRELRKMLVDSGMISTVILFPSGFFYATGIRTVLIHLTKNKNHNGVVFADAAPFCKLDKGKKILDYRALFEALSIGGDCVKWVSDNDHKLQSGLLDPKRFLAEDYSVPEDYIQVDMTNIAMFNKGQRADNVDKECRIVTPGDLSVDLFVWQKHPEEFSLGKVPQLAYLVDFPAILCSNIGGLRATFVDASPSSPVYCSSKISAFRVVYRECVYLPLFLYEMNRKGERILNNSLHDNIPPHEIMHWKLFLPSVQSQEAVYKTLLEQDKVAKAKELGLEDLIESQKRDFIQVLRNRKHDMQNCMGAVMSAANALSKGLKQNGIEDIALSSKVAKTFGEQMDGLLQLLKKMSDMQSRIADENIFGNPAKVDLCKVISSIKEEGNYQIIKAFDLNSLSCSLENLLEPEAFVWINEDDFSRVIDNIVGNARKHGFIDQERNGYQIRIQLSYNSDEKMFVIEFLNNGVPMPKGIDTFRYGIDGEKADSDGNGEGGAIVKNIVEHYGGSYEVINDPDSAFPVDILIKLPRYESE